MGVERCASTRFCTAGIAGLFADLPYVTQGLVTLISFEFLAA